MPGEVQIHFESLTAELPIGKPCKIIARLLLRAVVHPPSEDNPRVALGVFLLVDLASV